MTAPVSVVDLLQSSNFLSAEWLTAGCISSLPVSVGCVTIDQENENSSRRIGEKTLILTLRDIIYKKQRHALSHLKEAIPRKTSDHHERQIGSRTVLLAAGVATTTLMILSSPFCSSLRNHP